YCSTKFASRACVRSKERKKKRKENLKIDSIPGRF
ncbi:MAG: hypothetical protein ACI8RD_004850, partial [Bacillariaceae sp.]